MKTDFQKHKGSWSGETITRWTSWRNHFDSFFSCSLFMSSVCHMLQFQTSECVLSSLFCEQPKLILMYRCYSIITDSKSTDSTNTLSVEEKINYRRSTVFLTAFRTHWSANECYDGQFSETKIKTLFPCSCRQMFSLWSVETFPSLMESL